MRDFPLFDTEFGIASLVLKEVPYRREAYITVLSALQPEELIRECVSFCRMVGAEKVYAKGHDCLEAFPLHTVIYEMCGWAHVEEDKVECLWPVTETTVSQWRRMMNERMASVDNAATLEAADEKKILSSGGAYFVHREGACLGGFWLAQDEIRLVAALVPGSGERVMHTLFSLIPDSQLRLEVASTNERAVRFYEKFDFLKIREVSRWYRVFPEK